jgi:hypothetical protein
MMTASQSIIISDLTGDDGMLRDNMSEFANATNTGVLKARGIVLAFDAIDMRICCKSAWRFESAPLQLLINISHYFSTCKSGVPQKPHSMRSTPKKSKPHTIL